MKKKELVCVAMFCMLTMVSFGQEKEKQFGFELSSGLSVATNTLNGTELKPGFGFEGIFHYRFMPHLGVYGGWGWNRFGADNSNGSSAVCFEETGYVLGLQFKHPIGTLPLAYYLRGGVLYNHIETENNVGDIIHDTKHGFGFQFAGGVDINLGSNWSLTPGLKFNSLMKDIDVDGTTNQFHLNYLSLRIGILKKF